MICVNIMPKPMYRTEVNSPGSSRSFVKLSKLFNMLAFDTCDKERSLTHSSVHDDVAPVAAREAVRQTDRQTETSYD